MANYLKEKETSLSSDLQFEKPELLKYRSPHKWAWPLRKSVKIELTISFVITQKLT